MRYILARLQNLIKVTSRRNKKFQHNCDLPKNVQCHQIFWQLACFFVVVFFLSVTPHKRNVSMQKHRNLHTRLALADMNSMDSVFPLCKNNCKWLQHLLHAHRLHFSCVTIHSALREDEEYCSIKRFSPSPTAHPPTVVGRRIVLHFS